MREKQCEIRRRGRLGAVCRKHAGIVVAVAIIATPVGAVGQESAKSATGSEAAEKAEAKTRAVRLLAVGEAPVFRGTLRNGVLREAEPKPGTLPPLEVVAPTGEEERARARVMLGSISPPMRVPLSLRTLRLFEPGKEGGDAVPWVRASLPEGRQPLLIVLWRDPAEGKWTKARSLVLPDGLENSPPRSVRVVNVTPVLVAVRFGAEAKSIALRPGRSVLRRTNGGNPLQVSIAMAQPKGGWRRLYQGEASPAADERVRIFVFRSDGEEVRRPAKVTVMTERIR